MSQSKTTIVNVCGTSAALGFLLGDLKQNQSQIYRDILDHNLIPVTEVRELPAHWGVVRLTFEAGVVKAELIKISRTNPAHLFSSDYRVSSEEITAMTNLVNELRHHLNGVGV